MTLDTSGKSTFGKRKATPFDTWQEAFNYCREGNAPVVVRVEGETAKIFPSGHCKTLQVSTDEPPGESP